MKSFEQLANAAYSAYCKQAGGKTYDAKLLPTWAQLSEEHQSCWLAVAKQIVAEMAAVH